MVIKYRPGSEMLLADGLSRLPSMKNKKVIVLDIKVDFVQFSTEKLTQIRQATNADPTLCELCEFLKVGQNLAENYIKTILVLSRRALYRKWCIAQRGQDSDPQFNATRSLGEITLWPPRK